ncbi:MAG: thioredoxin domain-containing protein [Mariprofundaceae bacterium]|nr:thioredoxin domain-containing protein [Mariprofundaceae bacterium]
MLKAWMILSCVWLGIFHIDAAISGEDMTTHKYTNALIHEASPYLQQHAHNPVNWYPWGEEAFAKAKRENKPIFLSIGYATCHWCHVMEHESFEDEAVAAVMNETFVSIKVDREERPDIDQVYMQVAQMMNGSGGWPLNILMTPDKKPFYAATYIPKESRGGRIGMMILAPKVHDLWIHNRDKLEKSATEISAALKKQGQTDAIQGELKGKAWIKAAVTSMNQSFDEQYAGFGGAPKFPSPHKLLFLLREAKRTGDTVSLNRVEATLDAMRAGGIFDQIGFGFHRYSTDAAWLLPHFEKMLYDQAMLMLAYTEAYQATGHERHAKVVREIADYVLRDMTDSTGGFYSAEDADSEGVEGKFYVWRTLELARVLGKVDASIAEQAFQMRDAGNFHDEATGQATGENIPHLKAWTSNTLSPQLDGIRQRLLDARNTRIRPFLDDKILTDWNGLMIAALAKAGRVLHEPNYVKAAQKSADFLLKTMQSKQGLLHRYRHGDAAIMANLDDYTFLTWGLIELYEANFDARYLKSAITLNQTMLEKFQSESGGFFLTANDAEVLLVRPMEAWDGALPSGNAVAAHNLIRLSRISSDIRLENDAEKIFRHFSPLLKQAPVGLTYMLSAWSMAEEGGIEIVLAGDKESPEGQNFLTALNARYLPNAVVIWRDERSMALIPFIQLQSPVNGKVTAYVCRNFQCNQPVTSIKKMLDLLKK